MSTTRHRRPERGAAEDVWLSQPDPVGSWLDVLMGLIRLPQAERRSIRDELDSHLRDRVRDIMLTGLDEVSATREAIAELGDAAELATRFGRASRAPARRRLAMNIGMLGVACTALVTSVVALNGGSQPAGVSVYPGVSSAQPAQGAEVSIGALDAQSMPLEDVMQFIAASAGMRLVVDWGSLSGAGLEPVSEVTLNLKDANLDAAFDAIREATRDFVPMQLPADARLDYRISGKELRVASAHAFDMADRVIATIDISSVLERGVEENQVTELVMNFIEPDQWVESGGDVSTMSIVGGKMFIKAPPRVIEGTRWIVGQLEEPAQARGGNALGADEYVRMFKLTNVSAATMLAAIEPIYAAVAERTDPEAARLRFTADQQNPVIVVRGPKRLVEEACQIMSDMDAAKRASAEQAGTSPAAPLDSRLIPLKNSVAIEMAEVLRAAGTVSDRLRQSPRDRAIAVDAGSNGLYVRSTPEQVDAIEEILGLLDTDGPLDDRAIEESKTIKLERARAAEVRHVLGLALNANQRMKQCPVPRSFAVDASENTLTVTATPGQVEAIARMAEALDR
jgi:hypothetical protein